MGAAQKKAVALVKRETGHRTPNTGRSAGPFAEGPMLGLLRIRVSPLQFKAIGKSKFANVRLQSRDRRFAVDMIVKDVDSFLEVVPKKMPSIAIEMNAKEFSEKIERKTIVMLEDGLGNNRGYAIAALKPVELMDAGWGPRRKGYVN